MRDDDVAWVVGIAVVPSKEQITGIGHSHQCDGVAIMVDAAFGHGAGAFGVNRCRDGVFGQTEISGEGGVMREEDVSRVVGDAVVPIEECITGVWESLDGHGVAQGISAFANNAAHECVVDRHGEGAHGYGRFGRGGNHDEVRDDASGLIEDFAIFINRLCVSVIYAILVDD